MILTVFTSVVICALSASYFGAEYTYKITGYENENEKKEKLYKQEHYPVYFKASMILGIILLLFLTTIMPEIPQ
jgi:hypothetical protein